MPVKLREAEAPLFEPLVKKSPWVAYCEEPKCYFVVSAKTEEAAEKSLSIHKCPYHGSSERLLDKPLLSAMWRELDACMDGLMLAVQENVPAEKVSHYKSRAGGIATCLFIALGGPPGYYTTQDDITREAVRRYKMRIGAMEFEPTQGDNYDALRDSPTPRWESVVAELRTKGAASRETITPPPNKAPRQPRKPRAASAPASALRPPSSPVAFASMGLPGATSPRKLPDDVVTGIRTALMANMTPSQIAGIFQVSISDVESLQGE